MNVSEQPPNPPTVPLVSPPGHFGYTDICGIEFPFPALCRGWFHLWSDSGPFDGNRITAEIGADLWLSSLGALTDGTTNAEIEEPAGALAGFWHQSAFIELIRSRADELEDSIRYRLRVFASTPAAARDVGRELRHHFLAAPATDGTCPRIALLSVNFGSLSLSRVPIAADQLLLRSDMDIFYGDGAATWLDRWQIGLAGRRCGLSILGGDPGTGKTTLLRSLALWLSSSHAFYFMPAARFTDVESQELVTFWANESRVSKLQKVLVLEDAESVLFRRSGDNRERVATLLNLTDGIMGDALRLHVICTLNSDLSDLDPALLRPGRLLTRRTFRRLTGAAAMRLAARLGRTDFDDDSLSLAEAFHPVGPDEETQPGPPSRNLGFHAIANPSSCTS